MNEVDGEERVENTSSAASHPLSTRPVDCGARYGARMRSYGAREAPAKI